MQLIRTSAGRRLLFGLLYFVEGAPIGFLWWALPAYLRIQGVPVEQIAALVAALALPWTLKFLWAPVVDWSGHRRRWTIVCQLLMGLTLAAAVWSYLHAAPFWAAGFLLAHAVAAATQDVAVDAWAIASTPASEHGRLTASMQAGMLLGRWLFGAGLLVVLPRIGLLSSCLILVSVLWSVTALVWLTGEDKAAAAGLNGEVLRKRLGISLRQGRFWLGLAFALTAGLGFEAVGAAAGPYLVDRGLDTQETGWFLSGTVLLMLSGAFLGGRIADRCEPRRASAAALAVTAALVLALAAADSVASPLRFPALAAVYLGIGILTTSSYALFMKLADPTLGAAQFSAFMAATNACEAVAAFSAGRLIAALDYGPAFALTAAASLLGLPILIRIHTPKRATIAGND